MFGPPFFYGGDSATNDELYYEIRQLPLISEVLLCRRIRGPREQALLGQQLVFDRLRVKEGRFRQDRDEGPAEEVSRYGCQRG